jgi:tetrapyrrole methylase family protein / MazG family protein
MATESSAGIILMGLGPGDPLLVTRQVWRLLENATEVYLRTHQHPIVAEFPKTIQVYSFDDLYDQSNTFDEVYRTIVEKVIQLGRRPRGVVYGVPGHPFVAEATSPAIYRKAVEEGIPVKVLEGVAFLGPTLSALKVDLLPQTSIVDALEIAAAHTPPFPPDNPVIIAQIHSPSVASNLKLTLMEVYPEDHLVKFVHAAGTKFEQIEDMPLYEIDRSTQIGLLTTLYLPPLEPGTSFESFQEVIAHLRAPEGCPWDREQTHLTLRAHLLEETYETLTAIDEENPDALCEELGDLLLQIVLHAQIANEYGEFKMAEVLKRIHNKLVSRHPHVFSNLELADADSVVVNWEKLKAAERMENSKSQKGLLSGVASALPALMQAETYQQRAARVGFDWPNVEGVLDKIREEIVELHQVPGSDEFFAEFGDLLFALVNLARWKNIDAESSLRLANQRFRTRFEHIERHASAQGKTISDYTIDELESFWKAAKAAVKDETLPSENNFILDESSSDDDSSKDENFDHPG